MRRWAWRFFPLFAVFLFLFLFLSGPCWGAQAKTQTERGLEQERDSLNKRIQRYNELARQKEKESKTLLGQLDRLRQDATQSQAQARALEKEGKKLEESMKGLAREIERVKASIAELSPRFQSRVLALYKYGDGDGLEAVLSLNDANDAFSLVYTLRKLAREDEAVIDALAAKAEELSGALAKLEESRAQARNKATELKKKQEEHDAAIRKADALLKDVRGQEAKARSVAKELDGAQKEIGDRIQTLAARKKAQAEERAAKAAKEKAAKGKAEKPAKEKSGSKDKPAPKPAQTPGAAQTLAKGAALEWPVRGKVTAGFGSRVHPEFKTKVFNSGIDIAAASGAAVRCSGPGEVLYKGWMRGFGQVVIVDHGRGLSTVYAHLASAAVSEGERVRVGTILGTVGNSGADSEYGLHFEVRENGTARNPMNYLKKS